MIPTAERPHPHPHPYRDGSVDLIRALLVLYVIAYLHLGGYVAGGERHVHWSTPALTNVVLGTFTFLSGYVLGRWKGRTGARGLGCFYQRRLLRIYPLYLLALAMFVVLWLTDYRTAIKAVFAVSMFWPQPPMTLWFVTMIIVCYLLAPALIIPTRRRSLFAALILWLSILLFTFAVHAVDPRMLTQFAAFAGGIACRRFDLRGLAQQRLLTLATFFALSMAPAIAALRWPLAGALAAIPSVVLGPLFLLVLTDRHFAALGRHRIIVFLSYISFAAYLFHRVVFELVKRLLWPTSNGAQLTVLLLVGLPAVIALSALVQTGYDKLLSSDTEKRA